MKRNYRSRPLAFEQLESKAAPSSILPVNAGGDRDGACADTGSGLLPQEAKLLHKAELLVASSSVETPTLRVNNCGYETDQILQFITENTADGEHTHRPAACPTAAAAAVSDEMMRQVAVESDCFLRLGFDASESEL